MDNSLKNIEQEDWSQFSDLVTRAAMSAASKLGGLNFFKSLNLDHEDLVQIGWIAFARAKKSHKPDTGAPLGAWVNLKIRWLILDEIRKLAPSARSKFEVLSKAKKVQSNLIKELGPVEAQKVVESWGYDKILSASEEYVVTEISINAATDLDNPESTLEKFLGQEDSGAAGVDAIIDANQILRIAEKRLTALELEVVRLYFVQGFKLAEIAEQHEVTESRICQILQQALKVLRASVRKLEQPADHF